jgi:type IV pilus assembly protein PilN
MIKVNLLPGKRKKRSKPIPSFLVLTVLITIGVLVVMAYLAFFFSSTLAAKKALFAKHEQEIAELKAKIKAVDDFEKRNKTFKERNEIIEQLSRNKSVPVKILDEISALLPNGVWLQGMTVTGDGSLNLEGYGFTNSDIVSYVDNIKNSKMFAEVYLQESKSAELEKVPVYMFKLTFKIKA